MTTATIDPFEHPDVQSAFDWLAVEGEAAQRRQRAATAEVYDLIDRAMQRALINPSVFVDPSALSPADVREFTIRAAVLDLATRFAAAESTVRDRWHTTTVLKQRLPRFWQLFLDGAVAEAQAKISASVIDSLPEQGWSELDAALCAAARLTVPKFKARARALRERLHPESMTARHVRAFADREVRFEPEADGMGWLGIAHSGADLALANANIERLALTLATSDTEERTMAQLRADVAIDLLTGRRTGTGTGTGTPSIALALTVPVLSLLGRGSALPTLEGVGPIDLETARRLVGDATSFTRILTDPIRGTIVDIDRTNYRIPTAIRRWARVRDVTCTAPGCNRRAGSCDLDHTVAYRAEGATGTTALDNLAHLCRHHHRIKHQTRWSVEPDPATGRTTWTAPSGRRIPAEAPPF